MSIKMIACEVMKEELLMLIGEKPVEIEFIPMGFHLYPHKLRAELQRLIDLSTGYTRIILALGLCGGAVHHLKATDSILTIPRVHDCIPVLLGSRECFEACRQEEKGTFYLSIGWARGEKNILSSFQQNCERFGEIKARKILVRMYESYKRILFIHTGTRQEETGLKISQQIAALLNLEQQEVQGSPDFLQQMIEGPWDQQDFVNIPPHGQVDEMSFIFTS